MGKDDVTARHLARLEQIMEETPEQNWIHPWMYSFMPAKNEIYLVAYCKNCRKGITALMDHDIIPHKSVITQLDIPRFGCVPPV